MDSPSPPAFVVRESTIHGSGVFAARDIVAGEKIVEYRGEKITKAEAEQRGLAREARKDGAGRVYIFELNQRYDLDGDIPDNPAKFINHSCEENCEAVLERGKVWIYSKREIRAGEELTYDYGYALEHFLDHPCRCGSPRCARYIVHQTARTKLKQLLARARKRAGRRES